MDETLKGKLSKEQYHVLVDNGTERPFTGEFVNHKADGTYSCAACNNPLFNSETKFDSGCGWPSFYDIIKEGSVKEIKDKSHGMIRTEIVCAKCEGHLGHVFNDGPAEKTGLRYCINSLLSLIHI